MLTVFISFVHDSLKIYVNVLIGLLCKMSQDNKLYFIFVGELDM